MSFELSKIKVAPIGKRAAKRIVIENHYMKTWPMGNLLSLGVWYDDHVKGVMVFGKSSGTNKKVKLFDNRIAKNEIIEMQRMWLSDDLGHNAESKSLGLAMKLFKKYSPEIKVIWTYAGGCKNDCGIVYQASGFCYLGSEPCNDFYLTSKGEYKNLISAKRFGRVPKDLKTNEDIGKHLFGNGKMIKSKRYYYFYPVDKAIRRIMKKKSKPFPKDSLNWRKDQKWI